MPTNKIKLSLLWLRKRFEITETTTLPGEINGEVRPTVDVLGWHRRLDSSIIQIAGTLASDIVFGPTTPGDVQRLVTECSVESNDTTQAFNLQLVKRGRDSAAPFGLVDVGITDPVAILIGKQGVGRGTIGRPLLLNEGESILGRSFPAPAAGTQLRLKFFFIDLELGEYVAPL